MKSYLKYLFVFFVLFLFISKTTAFAEDLYIETPPASDIYYSDGQIIAQSNCVVAPGTKVMFAAVEGISLKVGFHAQAGSVFTATGVKDSDGDQLPDYWELYYFSNLSQGPSDNPDGDNWSNLTEYIMDTNPTASGDTFTDTDEDGLADAWEQYHFGNLNQNADDDPDGDGLTNLQEFQIDADPNTNDPDTDDDGLNDDWELTHFGNLDQTAEGDADGDGVSNYVEYVGNSDPNSAADKPKRGTRYEYDEIGRIKKIIRIK